MSCSKACRAPAKTLLAQAFAASLALKFGRIQFTPDLMPGDVLGTNLFNFQTNASRSPRARSSPQLLLADEINRTPPKTQAALLQAMQERAVTIDGQRLSARRRLHGDRDAEPDRAAGHLSAARGAARPLPVQDHRRLSRAATRSARSCAATAIARPCRGSRTSALQPVADCDGARRRCARGRGHPALRRTDRLHRRCGARDARARLARRRRLAARGQHAGRRRARLRRAAGPRLRHPRRRQGARAAGAAPPPRAVARRRDRRPERRPGSSREILDQEAAPR